jgi:hypothetical protein
MKEADRRSELLAGGVLAVSDRAAAKDAPTTGIGGVQMRVARATDDLSALMRFYRDGLGLQVLYEFRDHAGFDGVMLGTPGSPYHLEFTQTAAHPAGRAPGPENLLVFFLPEAAAYRAAMARMEASGFRPVQAFNPYWDKCGRTYEDPDGYRIVFQNSPWPPVDDSVDDGS